MSLKRTLIVVHRWLGVALCLCFALWFSSGIGMMYFDFPEVSAADRRLRAPGLDPAAIRLSPAAALTALGSATPPTNIRLSTFDGRPAYRFVIDRHEEVVYADSGERQVTVDDAMAIRIASAWVGQPATAATVENLGDADQWTVQLSLAALRPLSKYSWPTGDQVYVSRRSGDVVQFTTTAMRIGAYLGPVPHWLYFTPLRRHQTRWTATVIWLSGAGTATAVLGLVIGLWMYSPYQRYRRDGAPASLPYRGQKRWHAILGLIFGLGAVTWAFSGLLSMEPLSNANSHVTAGAMTPSVAMSQALQSSATLAAFAPLSPSDAVRRLNASTVKEIEFASLGGTPAYLAHLGDGETRVVSLDGHVTDAFHRSQIAAAIAPATAAFGGAETHQIDSYDAYYIDRRHRRPLPVLLVTVADDARSRFYIDPRTARIVGAYSSRDWVSRWLYHGLHSLDFPWLYRRRPLWDVVMILLMLGGMALSVTSAILAWRTVGRTLAWRTP